MKRLTSLVLSALLMSLPCQAQDQPILNPAGFSTRVPASFQVRQDASGSLVIDPQQKSVIVVKSHNYANFEAFAQDANLEKDGFALVGQVRSINSTDRTFRATRSTPQGLLVADTMVTFSPYGGGCLIVALSDPQNAQSAYETALQMAQNLRYGPPQTDRLWTAALAGKHLVYLYTGNGYSERLDLYLDNSGRFSRRNDASSTSQNGTGALAGGGEGNWQILAGGRLVLQNRDGSTATYQLAAGPRSNEVHLNGTRYFVLNP